MSKKSATNALCNNAVSKLRALLPRGATVYTVLCHVAPSGMTRRIKLLIPQVETRESRLYGAPLKTGMLVDNNVTYERGKVISTSRADGMIDVMIDGTPALYSADHLIGVRIEKVNVIRDLTYLAGEVLGWRVNDRAEMTVSGCGMDMGFHAVYQLAATIYSEDLGKKGHGSGDSKLGGYALNQRWL